MIVLEGRSEGSSDLGLRDSLAHRPFAQLSTSLVMCSLPFGALLRERHEIQRTCQIGAQVPNSTNAPSRLSRVAPIEPSRVLSVSIQPCPSSSPCSRSSPASAL